jgi:tRNA pseudouridine38-40 synthase
VEDIQVLEENGEIIIRISGNGFLYNMVRIIAGTLIRVGRGYYEPEKVKEILEAKERTEAGVTAPPQGLVLIEIRYN